MQDVTHLSFIKPLYTPAARCVVAVLEQQQVVGTQAGEETRK
jgi:hypothetical protein